MDDLISRKAAIEAAKHAWAKGLEPSQYIEIIPSVPAAHVVHGQWEYIPGDGKFRAILICSKCKKCVGEYDRFDYCPHCGAKMDRVNG